MRGSVGVHQDGNASHVRRNLLQHSKQFRSKARLHHRKARHITPGVGEALHEAISHRITPTYEYNGDRPSSFLCCLHRRIIVRQQHVRRLLQGALGCRSHPIGIASTPVKIELEISADCPAGLLKLVLEGRGAELPLWIVFGVQQ